MPNIFTEKIYINQIYFQVTYWVPTLSAYYSANAFIYFYMFYKEPNNSTWYTTNSLYLLLYIFTDLFKYNENTGNCTDLKSTIWEVFIHIHTCEAIPAVRMMETPTSGKSCLCFCRLLSHPRQPLICHYIGFYILKCYLHELKLCCFGGAWFLTRASQVAQLVKNLPAMQETWVWSLGWEDPQEKGTATHSSILAWRIPWTEEPGRLQPMGLQRLRDD